MKLSNVFMFLLILAGIGIWLVCLLLVLSTTPPAGNDPGGSNIAGILIAVVLVAALTIRARAANRAANRFHGNDQRETTTVIIPNLYDRQQTNRFETIRRYPDELVIHGSPSDMVHMDPYHQAAANELLRACHAGDLKVRFTQDERPGEPYRSVMSMAGPVDFATPSRKLRNEVKS